MTYSSLTLVLEDESKGPAGQVVLSAALSPDDTIFTQKFPLHKVLLVGFYSFHVSYILEPLFRAVSCCLDHY